ncbi:cytochrome-c peroxidase [Microscilla marina]|uniref:Methylamine utilization protein MauG n=1 Tax=Microscilla marina ATCC 23134 TaxID=313606 RepID=A1ZVL2_MICM2|nr:cytochrome c peroxidase [Microscilla marina]EAY25555.1 methylamine utilization protein MauG [Microscilla marina ATCC 23134]
MMRRIGYYTYIVFKVPVDTSFLQENAQAFMIKIRFKHIGLLLLVLCQMSCRKAEDTTPDNPPFSLNTPDHFGNSFVIPNDNPTTQAGVDLGRHLFFDKRLSSTNQVSCASCHQPAKAFTDGKAVSTGVNGRTTSRSAMSLVNLLWVDRLFWDGRSNTLEEQALLPIQDEREMGLTLEELTAKLQALPEYVTRFKQAFGTETISADLVAKALAQFQRTLISAGSRYDKIARGEVQPTTREQRAIDLFFTHPEPAAPIPLRGGNCGDCHGGNLTTLNTFHNNGLEVVPKDLGLAMVTGQASDQGKMRAPSLRNIALTAPYMHDGRFKTLEEVLDHYNEHIQAAQNLDPLITAASNEVQGKTLALTTQEKADIVFFLKMLTDSAFIQNPAFQNPFEQ